MSDEELAFDRVKFQFRVYGSADEGEYFVGDFEGAVLIESSREESWIAAREEALKRELDWLKQPAKEELI